MLDSEFSAFHYASAVGDTDLRSPTNSVCTRLALLPNGQQLFMAALAYAKNYHPSYNGASIKAATQFPYLLESLVAPKSNGIDAIPQDLPDAFKQALQMTFESIGERNTRGGDISFVAVALLEDGRGLIAHIGDWVGAHVIETTTGEFVSSTTPRTRALRSNGFNISMRQFELPPQQVLMLTSGELQFLNKDRVRGLISSLQPSHGSDLNRVALEIMNKLRRASTLFVMPAITQPENIIRPW